MRPTWGHRRQGEAWIDGKIEADNPYPEETISHLEWRAGNLSAACESGDLR